MSRYPSAVPRKQCTRYMGESQWQRKVGKTMQQHCLVWISLGLRTIRFSVSLVSGYVHYYVLTLLSVIIVPYPDNSAGRLVMGLTRKVFEPPMTSTPSGLNPLLISMAVSRPVTIGQVTGSAGGYRADEVFDAEECTPFLPPAVSTRTVGK